jgi:hypothetical protein
LTQLQREYKDKGLTIIGISNEEESKVTPFVRAQGKKMDYTVAVDRRQGTNSAWMAASGQRGIPCAFIVDRKGKIAFIGNPHPDAKEGFEQTLAKVMSGRYDPVAEKQANPVLKAARDARKQHNRRVASRHFDEVVALDSNIFASVGLEKFEMLLVDMGDKEQAYDYARNGLMGKAYASDPAALRMLAEKVASDPKIDKADRDMDLALEAAEAARRLAGDDDPDSMAAVAKVRFHRGEVNQAVDLQKQAYFNAAPSQKSEFKRVLGMYQSANEKVSLNTAKKPS